MVIIEKKSKQLVIVDDNNLTWDSLAKYFSLSKRNEFVPIVMQLEISKSLQAKRRLARVQKVISNYLLAKDHKTFEDLKTNTQKHCSNERFLRKFLHEKVKVWEKKIEHQYYQESNFIITIQAEENIKKSDNLTKRIFLDYFPDLFREIGQIIFQEFESIKSRTDQSQKDKEKTANNQKVLIEKEVRKAISKIFKQKPANLIDLNSLLQTFLGNSPIKTPKSYAKSIKISKFIANQKRNFLKQKNKKNTESQHSPSPHVEQEFFSFLLNCLNEQETN